MKKEEPTYAAQKIMTRFAALTGLVPAEQPPRRYLWTDAYAVCNFLGLYLGTKDIKYKDLALQLIDQVHNKLGRYREGDPRTGWISGLSDREGKEHPTARGLRIGKTMNERGPDEHMDECLEWSRDGQYYHYLTKWMHALNRTTVVTGDFTYNRWAIELAKAAHARFVYTVPGTDLRQMYWKMSTDLSYPLVPSMGHHDPLDGLVTYIQLQRTAEKDPARLRSSDLVEEIKDIAAICEGRDWQTDDLLGLGGLLSDAFRVAQLFVMGAVEGSGLLRVILDASLPGLGYPGRENFLHAPARYRLAFRELGLSIGLHALKRLDALIGENQDLFRDDRDIAVFLKTHWKYMSIGERIEAFWLDSQHQASPAWNEHRDINMVMLATSLAPDGFLTLSHTL